MRSIDPNNWQYLPNYALTLWKSGLLNEAAEIFAKYFTRKSDTINIPALSNDAELSLIRNDISRFMNRRSILLRSPQLPEDTRLVVEFLDWVIGNRSLPAILKRYDSKQSQKGVDWDFTDIEPVIQKLQPKKKADHARLLIELFTQKIDRREFEIRLEKLETAN